MPRAAVAVRAVWAVLVRLLWAFQRRLVSLPGDGPLPAAADVLPGGRDVELTTTDGLTLGGWSFPGRGTGAPAVLVAGGNGRNRALRTPLATALSSAGLAVLLFDSRGYGGNPGSPSEQGLALGVPPAGPVLRSPFVDLAAVGSEPFPFLPVRLLLRDRYPVAEQLAGVHAATTVVLGDADHNDAVLLDGDLLVDAGVELAARTTAD